MGLLLLFIVACTPSAHEQPAQQPNIVFILADDMGWRDVGFAGSTYYRTPTLDRLCANGIYFPYGYSSAPNCAPTRASILTGQYSNVHGVVTVNKSNKGDVRLQPLVPVPNTMTLDTGLATLPEYLGAAGYQTAFVGKWHLGQDPDSGPEANGFDVGIGGWERGSPQSYFSPYENPALPDGPAGEHLTDRLTEEGIKQISRMAKQEAPFFLYMSYYAVHTPLQAKPQDRALFENAPPDGKQNNPTYAAMVYNLDYNVAKLVNHLEEAGLMDNTILVFCSDNGGSWQATHNAPLSACKGSLREGGTRIPFFVYSPSRYPTPREVKVPVMTTDLLPSFLHWAGAAAVDSLVGEPLGEIMDQGMRHKPLIWYMPVYLPYSADTATAAAFRTVPGAAIRKGDHKLLWYYGEHTELYNIAADPAEQTDLAATKPALHDSLYRMLLAWHDEHAATIPTAPNPAYDSAYYHAEYRQLLVDY